MSKFQTGLSYLFPPEIVDYILKARKTYSEAVKHAELAHKYGCSVDPDSMTKKELVNWYQNCLCTD